MPDSHSTFAVRARPIGLPRWRSLGLAIILGTAFTAALMVRFGAAYAQPLVTTITVKNTNDGGAESLRQALVDAGDGDTIDFQLPDNSIITVTTDLTVPTAVIIDGATAVNLILSGGGATRVFTVTAPLQLISLTVTGGAGGGRGGGLYSTSDLTLTSVTFYSNTSSGRGGGLFTLGALTASASNFLTNTAQGGRGGGAYAEGPVMLLDGLFLNNRTVGAFSGGGLGATAAAQITGTQFISNTAGDSGGGMRVGGATLNGVTVRDNFATSIGGGAYIAGPATITDSTFVANHALADGGGAEFTGDVALFGGSFISNTSGGAGGGVYSGNGVVFSGTLFSGNAASGSGGGLFNNGTPVVGEGGLLLNNTAGDNGGALATGGGALLTGTQIISNSADKGGGALIGGSASRLVNVVVARNAGGGLYLDTTNGVDVIHATLVGPAVASGPAVTVNGAAALTNTIVSNYALGLSLVGGTATADYMLFYSNTVNAGAGVTLGVNLRTGNPYFVSPAADDYHLGLGSAATNSGVDAGIVLDLDGASRPFNGAFDMGAYERHAAPDLYIFLPLILR